jgi:hypothetical protein
MFQIYFHGQDFESLHSHIDPKFLPKRYGGMRPEYSYTDWVQSFLSNKTIMAGEHVVMPSSRQTDCRSLKYTDIPLNVQRVIHNFRFP